MARRRSAKRGTYWDGLQWPQTAIVTTGTLFELIGATAQEFMPATLVSIRGSISLMNVSASGPVEAYMKILYVELNDAGTMTGDHAGLDTHEEDIATRHLWSGVRVIGSSEAGPTEEQSVHIDIDVKSKLRLHPGGKHGLILLFDTNSDTRLVCMGYLRCLLLHG